MFRCMKRRMFTTTYDLKVTNSIIFNIVVLMVNYLIKMKSSIKMSFHNNSMFSNVAFFPSSSFLLGNHIRMYPKLSTFFPPFQRPLNFPSPEHLREQNLIGLPPLP